MVNAAATPTDERRERARGSAPAHALGAAKLNPFGDLHTLQHLSARLARTLKSVWEPILRREVRSWAEPLMVQRFADYRAERSDTLTAWLPVAMSGAGQAGAALVVFDGRWVLEVLDLFFGGTGHAPAHMPVEFSPAAEAMVGRLGASLCPPLRAAWEPLTRVDFQPGRIEASGALIGGFDADEAAVVTRFGLASAGGTPVFIDILYSVAALKPHAATLTGRVLDKAEPDPAWRQELTRSVMNVRFPVRSVLAEPVVPLSTLMALKPGDIIPINVTPNVPVMVGRDRLGVGTVGAANGRAAIQLTSLARIEGLNA